MSHDIDPYLLAMLQSLIDTYGRAGVIRTLDEMDHPETVQTLDYTPIPVPELRVRRGGIRYGVRYGVQEETLL